MPFLGPEWPICPEQIFVQYKPLLLLSFTYWDFSLCKILPVDPELWGCPIFWAQNEIFFRKSVNEPCFFNSCLSTCQKLKLDINL